MVVICKKCGKKTPEGKLCQICGAFLAPPIQCPGCGRTTAAGITKCAYCGAAIVPVKPPDLIACPKCGRKMAAHLVACVMCGTPLGAAKAATPAADPLARLSYEEAMQKAVGHLQAGQWPEALPFVERALVFKPGAAELWSLKGACLHNSRRYAEALPCYQTSVKLRPDDPETNYNLGNTLRLLLRLEEAAAAYERACRLNPLNAEFQTNYAMLLRHLGRYGEAIPACHAVLAAKPDAPLFLDCLGFCLFSVGKPEQAAALLARAATAEPQRSTLWVDLGLCLEALRKQSEADVAFEQASKVDALSASPNFHHARLLERRGDKAGAAEHYYRAGVVFLAEQRGMPLSLQSQHEQKAAREGLQRLRTHLARTANPNVLFTRALRAEGEDRWDEALGLYEEVGVFAPENRLAADGAARMRMARKGEATKLPELGRLAQTAADLESGDAAKGLQAANELLASAFPHKTLLLVMVGQGLLRLGRADEALVSFDLALRQSPDDVSAWTGRAEVFLVRGDLEKTSSALDEAMKRDPRDPAAWTFRGDLLQRQGQPAEALECYAKAMAVEQGFAPAWAGKAEAEEALGRAEDMKKSYATYLSLKPPPSPRRERAQAKIAALEAAAQARAERIKKAMEDAVHGDAAAALAVLDEVLAQPNAPDPAALSAQKGRALARLGRYDEAQAAFDKSIAFDEKKSAGWAGKAELYELQGDPLKALEAAETATQRSTGDPTAWAVKGHCLLRLKQPAVALPCFEEALRHERDHERAIFGKALADDALGKREDALLSYLKFLEPKRRRRPEDQATAGRRVDELLHERPTSELKDPIELVDRGEALKDCGRLEEALACALRNVELNMGSGAWLAAATLYNDMKRHDEAIAAINRALEPNPRDQTIVMIQSFILNCAGREAESKEVLEKLGAVDLVREAQQFSKEGKTPEALVRYEKALTLDPDHEEAWCGKGYALVILGRSPDALPCFQRALEIRPDYRLALGGLGESLMDAKRFKEAEATFLRCRELAPDDPRPLVYLAAARQNMGQKQQAFEDYARFIWGAPAGMREQLKIAREQHGNLLKELRPPIPKPPSLGSDKWHEKAGEFLKRGRLQEAVATYDACLKAYPYDVTALLNRGSCLLQLGRAEEALKSLDQAVKLAPKMCGGWLMKGSALGNLGRPEEGLRCLEKATELDPYESAAWGNRAASLNGLKRPADALPCLERALILDPFNVVAWYNRGCTEHALDRTKEAKGSFQRFLAIAPEGMEDQIEDAKRRVQEFETGKPQDRGTVVEIDAKPRRVIGNRYEIYKELGRGGFGVVYLALTRDRQEPCALKTFLDERAADPETVKMFKAEAKTWIELDAHPHLVRAYYVDEIDGRLYLAMELIAPGPDGCNTLEAYLRNKPPGLTQSLRWAIQFCHGMEYAYTKGVRAHRDIKPANIMIDGQRKLKISDFGLAAVMSSRSAKPQLQLRDGNVGLSMQGEGGGAGTPTHMPPEQWRSGAACDERSDLYAFGVTLYQMASKGKLPFMPALPRSAAAEEQERFMGELFRMHLNAAPAPLNSPLWPLVERCLKKNPAERFRSFRELRAELEPLLKGQAQGETVPAPEIGKLDADELVNKAHSLDALGRADEALKTLDDALRMSPDRPLALVGKGFVLARIGRIPEALTVFDRAITVDPNGAVGYYNKANTLSQAGRHRDALPVYQRALELEPGNATTWRNKARCLYALGRHDEAGQAFDRALAIDPESAIGWIDKGELLRDAGHLEEAAAALRKAVAVDPSRAVAWNMLGEMLMGLNKFGEGLPAFERAVALDPSNYSTWVNRGGCLASAGRYADAMASYDHAITLSSEPAMAWNNKGDLFVRMNQPAKAMECFDRALQIEPNMALAVQNKALRLRDLGRVDDAIAILDGGLQAHPDHSGLWYFTGEFLVMKKDFVRALAAYGKTIQHEKANIRAIAFSFCRIGQCQEKLGNPEKAAPAFQKALEILPDYKDAVDGLSRTSGRT